LQSLGKGEVERKKKVEKRGVRMRTKQGVISKRWQKALFTEQHLAILRSHTKGRTVGPKKKKNKKQQRSEMEKRKNQKKGFPQGKCPRITGKKQRQMGEKGTTNWRTMSSKKSQRAPTNGGGVSD